MGALRRSFSKKASSDPIQKENREIYYQNSDNDQPHLSVMSTYKGQIFPVRKHHDADKNSDKNPRKNKMPCAYSTHALLRFGL